MQWSLVLVSILGLTISSPIDTDVVRVATPDGDVTIRNSLIESQLRELLEELRQTMVEGSDTVPVLDPLDLPVVKVDENNVLEPVLFPLPESVPGSNNKFHQVSAINSINRLHLTANDVTLHHLSTFVVNALNAQMTSLIPIRYRLSFDIDVPVLELDVDHYDLGVLVEGFTLFGNGQAKINVVRGGISGNVLARVIAGFGSLHIRLESANIRVTLKDFNSQITGLLGGDEGLNAFVNTFLGFFVPEAVTMYEEEITQIVSDIVLEVGNDVLADLNLIDVLG